MPSKKTIIIIAGPTASGKTALAISAAKLLGTEIISCDSRQCYRELSVGVARPSPAELSEVPHHFIASHSIHEKITATTFEAFALKKSAELFKQTDHVVMTGGTGLYIRAFCEGFDEIPEPPEVLRAQIRSAYEAGGLDWLTARIGEEDPAFLETGESQNPHRLLRALEVKRSTGRSILEFRSGKKAERDFKIVKLALELPRDLLYDRINARVQSMMDHGLEAEVRSLIPYQHLKALQTVGYQELFDHFNGMVSLGDAVKNICTNTRHYAKRQITWFRKETEITWMPPDEKTLLAFIQQKLQ
jgi:tRNA dimethylallyltransferase